MNKNNRLEKNIFELVCYMIICAKTLDSEKKEYGPLRMVESTSRLIEVLERNGIIEDNFIQQIRIQIENNKNSIMTSKDYFMNFLDGMIIKMIKELKRRDDHSIKEK